MARIVCGQTKALRNQEFVVAAKACGASDTRILMKHVFPNLLGPVIVYMTLMIPAVILLESVLSFLGLGVQPPMSSWGILINDGAKKIDIYPWMLIFPALFFSLTIFSLNFVGDGLRDALDPKNKLGKQTVQ
jgi:oligopeptide transport system permease protein